MWHFWIDVGGTFTDCLGQSPSGEVRQTKVLSSGRFKGRLHLNDQTDAARTGDSPNFWTRARLNLLDATGDIMWSATVASFDAGRFAFDGAVIPPSILAAHQTLAYELDPGQHAPLMAMRVLTSTPIDQPLPAVAVHLGTTRGTNALLTRSGARTALVTSRGLKDFLTIGDQARPQLFELAIRKPQLLFETSIEVDERVLADGTVERVPDKSIVRQQLSSLKAAGIQSIAVCLIHGYRFPAHEQLIGRVARELGFAEVRLSYEVSPLIKLIPRGETTVLDAYLNPVIGGYLDEMEAGLTPGSQLQLMTSAGGLVSRARFSGKDSVLSGPAGGVVGAARVAAQFGFQKVIGFDMGGTSTDVSRYESTGGEDSFEREYESRKAGVRIVTPMMAIETVAAGGGSVCWFDGTKLRVGPKSAGADPGPACYGKGGPLAVTDVNFFLGRIDAASFPFSLDRAAVERRLSELCRALADAGFEYDPQQLAVGFLEIANHSMAAAISTVSVAKGYAPDDHVLLSFGGAGSQHCCGVAENLGMQTILDHPQSSILSAVGIRLADRSSHASAGLNETFDEEMTRRIEPQFVALEEVSMQSLTDVDPLQPAAAVDSGTPTSDGFRVVRRLDMRFEGTEQWLTIDQPNDDDYAACFLKQHQVLYGYVLDRPIEVVAARVEAIVQGNRLAPVERPGQFVVARATKAQAMSSGGLACSAARFDRSSIVVGTKIIGPAIVTDRHSTTLVDVGWTAKAIGQGALLLEHVSRATAAAKQPALRITLSALKNPDPVQLEIFNRSFASIARQMGIVLQRTSVSVNVKERLDFSCAIFTEAGDLVVNAPHIPVHLGAMSETVRETIRRNPKVVPGDVFVTNDPYAGGSHLPDVTVISPVFDDAEPDDAEPDDAEPKLMFWVASRSHHAEIGGKAPGSMPANARFLAEEGVLIDNVKLVAAGVEQFEQIKTILSGPPYPSRNVPENVSDLAAQVAANQSGSRDLIALVHRYSLKTVRQYMGFIQAAAEQKARAAIARLPADTMTFSDQLDNGAKIQAEIRRTGDSLEINFTGTDPVTADNLNANRAIVSSAVMYVVRCLVDEDIPLNEGLLRPIKIHLPECLLSPLPGDRHPHNSPALVGGNVETSQRVVDVLLGALGIAAASQGTMNNWLIGDKTFGYYETVGGGSGATSVADGIDAVHTHMTNTRLTDPETLESRYPCILRAFAVRTGSGGAGQHRGGDGMIREIEFTRPLTLSLLTGRRRSSPYGTRGGQAGQPGRNRLVEDDGSEVALDWRCEVGVEAGQRLRLETPGGGGFGDPSAGSPPHSSP